MIGFNTIKLIHLKLIFLYFRSVVRGNRKRAEQSDTWPLRSWQTATPGVAGKALGKRQESVGNWKMTPAQPVEMHSANEAGPEAREASKQDTKREHRQLWEFSLNATDMSICQLLFEFIFFRFSPFVAHYGLLAIH